MSSNEFGEGSGPFAFNSVQCSGQESLLADCRHGISLRYCTHSREVGVRCQQRTSEWLAERERVGYYTCNTFKQEAKCLFTHVQCT